MSTKRPSWHHLALLSLLWSGPASASMCLLPVEQGDGDPGRAFVSRQGDLLATKTGLFRLSPSGSVGHSITGLGKNERVVGVVDAVDGVFVQSELWLGEHLEGGQVYRLTTDWRLESLVEGNDIRRFHSLDVGPTGELVILANKGPTGQVEFYKVLDTKLQKVEVADQRPVLQKDIVHAKSVHANVPSQTFVILDQSYLYRLDNDRLLPIGDWTIGPVFPGAAATTAKGTLLAGAVGVSVIGEDGLLAAAVDIPPGTPVHGFYEFGKDVFAASTQGLYRFEGNGKFDRVSGSYGNIASVHKLDNTIYVLANDGVFYYDGGVLRSLGAGTVGGIFRPGVEVVHDGVVTAVFFIASDKRAYRLSADRKVIEQSLPRIGPEAQDDMLANAEFIPTRVGVLLQAMDSLYVNTTDSRWAKIPGPPLSWIEDELVAPGDRFGPLEGPDDSSREAPTFVNTPDTVLRLVESPLNSLDVQFTPSLAAEFAPGELPSVRWQLRNFPCAGVGSALNQTLHLKNPGGLERELPIRREPNTPQGVEASQSLVAAVPTFSAAIDPQFTRDAGPYRLAYAFEDPVTQERIAKETNFTIQWPLSLYIVAGWDWLKSINIYIKITIALSSVLILLVVAYFNRICIAKTIRYRIHKLRSDANASDQIFISYRRDDAGGYAKYVHEAMSQFFDKELIFFDQGRIHKGEKFDGQLQVAVKNCSALLAMIGPDWLEMRDVDTGKRRLDQPEDYVRGEIGLALQERKVIIPILLGSAKMPRPQDLPDELSTLTVYDALSLADRVEIYTAQLAELALVLAKCPNIPCPRLRRRFHRAA